MSQVGPRVICGGQSGTGKGLSPSTSVSPLQYHSVHAPLSSSSQYRSHQTDNCAKLGNILQSNILLDLGYLRTLKQLYISKDLNVKQSSTL